MAPPQRVLVSYSGAQAFLSSGSWDQIHTALLAQLPLRNIHWKSPSRPSIRTIQELDISLVPLESLRDEHTSQIPETLLEKPFLNIYIVTCEDTDLETYKNTIKRQVKDWHTVVTARKNQEWLILHVVRPDARTPSANFFQLKGSVSDKLKTDFNTDRRDRCVQLAWTSGYDNPAAWAEFVNKLKDGLLTSFDLAVSQREDDVKRSESQRQMPGWNFCTFFILKESLAGSFQGVNLFEDALLQYDELEASFYQVLKEKNLSWFGTLITPSSNDDSCPLLSISKKPYRDLILANTISVFDFRIYLLARQCELLANLGRVNEVSGKASAFLGAFGRRLSEIEDTTIPEFFVESWTYSSALSVVDQCDAWASTLSLQGTKLSTFNAGKGELLELARNQLDIIGVKVGHLPIRPPFCNSSRPPPCSGSPDSEKKISSTDILESIENKDKFFETYVEITNRAIDMYAKAGRRKFALKLHGSLAALDVHRGRLAAALTTYTSLPAHYAPHMWTSLESLMLSLALDTHAELDKTRDREWIHILLSFLKTYVDTVGLDLLMHEEDSVEYISRLVQAMRDAATALETDLAHPEHPAMSMQVSLAAKLAGDKDGSFLDVVVHNHLPCALPIDGIVAILSGRDSERLRFAAPSDTIPPGKTEVTLFCPTSSAGTYILESTEARMSHLVFQWTHRKPSPGRRFSRKNGFSLVRIPRDLLAVDVRLHQPNLIELGKPPSLLVAISTGRNHVAKAAIKFNVPSVTFRYKQAKLTNVQNNINPLEVDDACISILDLTEASHLELLLPYSDASAFHAMKVDVEVEYTTVAEPEITRTLHLNRVVATTLPISVNVQDFFRGNRLFSKFTISTTSHQHVRISAAQLQIPDGGLDGLKVVACSPQARSVVTVTPAQSANFLFYLDSVNGPVGESLKFRISYRMLREEVEALIETSVEQVLSSSTALLAERVELVNKLVEALEQDSAWVEMYGMSGELNVPEVFGELGDGDDPLHRVIKLLHEHKHPHPPVGKWREIKIPVDVPYMNIVAAACIRLESTSISSDVEHTPSLYAGQPIPAILTIHTSFHWGSSVHDKERAYMMRFDVEEMVREWLVSGRKRGDFAAKDDATYSVPITLIALHHGELVLPKVMVTALPLAGEVTMGSMAIPSTETYQVHGAEKILVLPRGGRSTFVLGMGSG